MTLKKIIFDEYKYKYELAFMLSLILISIAFALKRVCLSDFIPINGDFQNYNVFRRLLDGQIPFKDFTNYLGMGNIYINLPLIALRNNFTFSLFVTNFTVCMCFALAVSTVLFLITGKKPFSYLGGIFLLMFRAFDEGTFIFELLKRVFPFFSLVRTGGSMRVERSFLPVLLTLFFYIVIKKKNIDVFEAVKRRSVFAVLGLIIGFFITWSNDYGFACFGAATVMLFIMAVFSYKRLNCKTILNMLIFVVAAAVGFLISVCLVTRFHPLSYFEFTFGVTEYQFWYYGIRADKKILGFIDLFTRSKTVVPYLALFCAVAVIFIVKLARKKITSNEILCCFIVLSSFFAWGIYVYGSGEISMEALSLFSFVAIVGFIWKWLCGSCLKKAVKTFNSVFCVGLVCSLVTGVALISFYAVKFCGEHEEPYVEGLSGYCTWGESMEEACELIGDEPVFSTYASALETMMDTYQPSRSDYIIHVLGDDSRAEYIKTFIQGDYKYVTTIKDSITIYESWNKRSGWFFYKELYKNYEPVSETDYNIIWQKTESENTIDADITAEIVRIDESTCDIVLTTDSTEDMIVDVTLNYEMESVFNLKRLLNYKSIVAVTDDSMVMENLYFYNNYFLPDSSDGYSIPITVSGGTGKITISSMPTGCTKLTVNSATVGEAYHNHIYEWEKPERIERFFTDFIPEKIRRLWQ